MERQRRTFTPTEKIAILRRHLLEKEPISKLCDDNSLSPTLFYKWQKDLFDNGACAFERRGDARERELQQRIEALTGKLARKDEVIAELLEEYVALKKGLGAA